MFRMTSTFVAAAVAAISSSAMADVPFQPLADFGLGGQPSDVNSAGIIVGSVRVENEPGPYVPVIWQTSSSAPTPLPTVNGGYAVAINSNGDIVGTEFQVSGVYGIPVLWSNGERIELPDLGEGGYANDINEAGVIIGNVISKGQYRAARWVNRELELLPLPEFETDDGVIWSFANTINSAGVISGTIQAPIGTPSAALRWDSEGVEFVQSEGLETKGISVDNLGGILINGYFDGGVSRAPAVVQDNGTVNVLQIPAELFGGASGLAMGRNGIVAGYYYASGDSGFQIKAVAWPNGVFTPLEMPAGQRYAFPGAVGMNGMVFGSATDGQTGRSVPGFWQLDIEGSTPPLDAGQRRTRADRPARRRKRPQLGCECRLQRGGPRQRRDRRPVGHELAGQGDRQLHDPAVRDRQPAHRPVQGRDRRHHDDRDPDRVRLRGGRPQLRHPRQRAGSRRSALGLGPDWRSRPEPRRFGQRSRPRGAPLGLDGLIRPAASDRDDKLFSSSKAPRSLGAPSFVLTLWQRRFLMRSEGPGRSSRGSSPRKAGRAKELHACGL
jgi:hypothetical protein